MSLKRISDKLYNFGSSLVGNRVLDLYLKYNGIKMLTTATLVPVALILGKDVFENIIKKQEGGVLNIPNDLPVIDDPLVGNYLKLAGVSTLTNLSPYTLVPIGVLMFIYHLYERNVNNEQQGGAELMNYVQKTWGNRVLDLFLKYKGLTMLTPASMVPLGLILGKDVLEDVLVQKGGSNSPIPEDLPILDDPLVGNYLKLAGLSIIELSPNTLLPLGLLALLYNIYFER